GERDRAVERAGNDMRHATVELGRERGGGFAGQIGPGHARGEGRQRRGAAGLRPAPGEPEKGGGTGGGPRRRNPAGRRWGLDEEHAALAADLLHPVRQAGKRAQALLDDRRRYAERERRPGGAGGILCVVYTAQRADLPEAGDRPRGAAGGVHDLLGLDIEAV